MAAGDREAVRQVVRGFHVFITGDRNLLSQQNVPRLSITVVVLAAQSIRLVHTRPLMSYEGPPAPHGPPSPLPSLSVTPP
jgi:hypothetical protein